jgi:hypothetical protein
MNVICEFSKNAVAGAGLSFFGGVLPTYLVRNLEGHPYYSFHWGHPLISSSKVMAITLPIWGLYKHYLEEHTPKALRPVAFSIIFLAAILGVSKLEGTPFSAVTPLHALAYALTCIGWQIFLELPWGKRLMHSE